MRLMWHFCEGKRLDKFDFMVKLFSFCYVDYCVGDDLALKKTRLKQWAQVVACAVRESSSSSSLGSNPSDHVN